MADPKKLNPRTQPRQQRSIKRAQEIMDVTAKLLDRVGFDELTTILITKELGISVGSLYHYFPNKQAILYSLAESWLKDWDVALDEISQLAVEQLEQSIIAENITTILLKVYQQQRGVLPLVHAMYAVPELRDLDAQHDKLVIKKMSALFIRMGFNQTKVELARIATVFLEISHSYLVMVIEQNPKHSARTQKDLNNFILTLFNRYQ